MCKIKLMFSKPLKKKFSTFLISICVIIILLLGHNITYRVLEKTAILSTAIISPKTTFCVLKESCTKESATNDKPLAQKVTQAEAILQNKEENNANDESYLHLKTENEENNAPLEPNTSKQENNMPIEGVDKKLSPVIPQEYRARLVTEHFGGTYDGNMFSKKGDVLIRNYTKLHDEEITEILSTPFKAKVKDITKPTVLIYHTHTTESFEEYDSDVYDTRNTWRSTDNTKNMAYVGEALASELKKYGINVIHDVTQHDYPSYNGSYERSRETVKKYLDEYPEIIFTIDIHRDGIVRKDKSVVKPTAIIDGKKYAQLMIIAPCGNSQIKVPRWKENFRLAVELTQIISNENKDIMRPVFLAHRFYNLDLRTGSLLFEIGSNGNTLEEAVNTAKFIAKPIAEYIICLSNSKN